jgi:uroporphyrinogen decarboxylase
MRGVSVTEKALVKRTIEFGKTDRIPWQINCTSVLAEAYMRALGLSEKNRSVLGKNVYRFNELEDYFHNHLAFLRNRAVNSLKEVSPHIFVDEWGVRWDRSIDRDIGNPGPPLLSKRSLDGLRVPDPADPDRFAHFHPLIDASPDRYLIVKFSYSLFERAWSLRGMENLMVDMVQAPEFVHELLDVIADFNLRLISCLTAYPVDGIYFGDDWGGQRGLLMSPAMWRRFLKPHLERMYAAAHELGCDVFIHSCGDISLLLDDLVEIGLNVFNPFQPEVMKVEEIIRKYSGRLAFYGGLSIQKTLPFGSPQDVERETAHRLRLAREYGGLILSPSHDMPPDVPLENTLAMLEALANQKPSGPGG